MDKSKCCKETRIEEHLTLIMLIAVTAAVLILVQLARASEHKLLPADNAAGDSLGRSVSVSGNIAVVGASNDDDNGSNSGSVYIFYRHQGGVDNWGQVAKITASDGQANDFFGGSLSISGDYIIVGAYGEDGGSGSPAPAR